jgi:hypothetical protein
MEETKEEKSIIDNVISQIKRGDTKMKPKWHFVLKTTLLAIGTFFVSITLLYIVSLVIFILRKNGVIFVPLFGLKGLSVFIFSIPWILITLSIAFVIVLEILIKHYSFTYKRPLLYSLLGIVVVMTIGGVMVFKARIHDSLLKYAEDAKLPVIKYFYREYGLQKLDNVYIGNIKEIFDDRFVMDNSHYEDIEVIITDDTELPIGVDLEEGDNVVVLGELKGDEIIALGVRMLNERMLQKLNNLETKKKHMLNRVKKEF